MPQAGEHLDAVLLDLLARTAPVALLAAREVGVDRVAVELETRGQAGQTIATSAGPCDSPAVSSRRLTNGRVVPRA